MELLVVIVIIVILISAVLVASSTLINKAKVSNTQAMLTIVRDAVEQFKREQTANPTIAREEAYQERYGYFPPDELEVFTDYGIPGDPPVPGTRAPGGAVMVPAPAQPNVGYPEMRFYTKGLSDEERAMEFRDQVAMVVAIQILGDASSSILDRLDDRYWFAPLDADGNNPAVFLDRPESAGDEPNEEWNPWDHQVRYIVDDWGNPIGYMAQRDWLPPPATNTISTNHPNWSEASTKLVRLNGGQPVIFSYGPNGDEQLTEERMGDEGKASIVGDFEGLDNTQRQQIDNLLNADNIYADPTLKEKLVKGIE